MTSLSSPVEFLFKLVFVLCIASWGAISEKLWADDFDRCGPDFVP